MLTLKSLSLRLEMPSVSARRVRCSGRAKRRDTRAITGKVIANVMMKLSHVESKARSSTTNIVLARIALVAVSSAILPSSEKRAMEASLANPELLHTPIERLPAQAEVARRLRHDATRALQGVFDLLAIGLTLDRTRLDAVLRQTQSRCPDDAIRGQQACTPDDVAQLADISWP